MICPPPKRDVQRSVSIKARRLATPNAELTGPAPGGAFLEGREAGSPRPWQEQPRGGVRVERRVRAGTRLLVNRRPVVDDGRPGWDRMVREPAPNSLLRVMP